MFKLLETRLRQDLIVTSTKDKTTGQKIYLVKQPTNGETFEFQEEEYFLCQAIDGQSTTSEILESFKTRFGLSITEKNFYDFASQIAQYGLLEAYNPHEELLKSTSSFLESDPDIDFDTEESTTDVLTESEQIHKPERKPSSDRLEEYRWHIFNPNPLYLFLANLCKPYGWFFKNLVWIIFILAPIILIVYLRDQDIIWGEIKSSSGGESFVFKLLFHMLTLNLISRIIQGATSTALGASVTKFSIQLRFGIVPRFHNDRRGYRSLSRRNKIWTVACPLIDRLFFFVLGTIIWYCTHGNGTYLPILAISFAQAGLYGFLILSLPIWGEGYRLFVLFFNLPTQTFQHALKVLILKIQRRPIPPTISPDKQFKLLLYSFVIITLWTILIIKVISGTSNGIAKSYPNIFGRGTAFIIFGIISFIGLTWASKKWAKRVKKQKLLKRSQQAHLDTQNSSENILINKTPKRNWLKLLLAILFGIILFLPYPYQPGGTFQLLPPKQGQIQSPISGRISKVFYQGGDGKMIKSEALIATIESVDLNNNLLTTQQQVNEEQAKLGKSKSNLNKLTSDPNPDEVEVSKKKVEGAKQEVEVARSQLRVAQTKAEFSQRQANRLQGLYRQGAYSLQLLEESQKQAETDQINVQAARDNIITKQKEVEEAEASFRIVLSGSPTDDIESAKQEVLAAQANLNRIKQQLSYSQQQLQSTHLKMPFDGHLINSFLDRKVGSFIKEGETFATAEDDRNMIAQLSVPEYDVGGFTLGRRVEVKLLAYPNEAIAGKVLSIEPSTTQEEKDNPSKIQTIKVNVEIANSDPQRILKPGMTGYAKIDGGKMLVIVAFTRPLIRFIQVELWSWLP